MRSGGRRCLGWFLVTLAWALPARAQDVTGIVVDPQDRRIVGASVVLTCAETALQAVTDGDGRFTFRVEAADGRCTVRVTAPRFAAATLPAGAAAGGPAIVRLALAPVTETIEVRASAAGVAEADAGFVLTASEMRKISDDPAEILRVAKARAGPAAGHAIYVDGLPAQQLPPVSRMAALAIAADPYSAEYSDPGLRRIDVTTLAPDRDWKVDFGGTPGTIDGASALGDRTHSRSLRAGVGGPSPWAGGAFSLHADMDALDGERAVVAVVQGDRIPAGDLARYATRRHSVSLQLYQAVTAGGGVRVEASRMAGDDSNAGVGGEVLPEAAVSRDESAAQLRVLANHDWKSASWRSQLLGNWSTFATRAVSSSPAIQVQGAFVGGGAPTSSATAEQGRLFWKNIVASRTGRVSWRAGFSIERSVETRRQVPSGAGSIQVSSFDAWRAALNGEPAATVFRFAGSTVQRMALTDSAGFAEGALVQRPNLRLTAGVRLDWQSRDRPRLSPRVSAVGQFGAWTIAAGAGLFSATWEPALFLGTRAAKGTVPLVLMTRQVSLGSVAGGGGAGSPIVMDVAPGLTRARYVMASQSAERPFGPVSIGVDHLWWRGSHLPGAERLPDQASNGWTDWLESNRRFDSHQFRVRVAAGGPNRNASLAYGWTRANDDTGGPWSFPARQGDIAAEWARSARVAAHTFDAVASASLPGSLHLTVLGSLRGSSPYDIVSGRDVEGNGLYTDRGGLPRNSGRLAGPRSIALYLHRRFNLASALGPRADVPIDAGLQVDNVFGGRAWTLVGNVTGSPLFGRPESAMPGRSVRVWFALAR